jgi:hypothetical protein
MDHFDLSSPGNLASMILVASRIYPFPQLGMVDPWIGPRNAFIGRYLHLSGPGFSHCRANIFQNDAHFQAIVEHFEGARLWHPGAVRYLDRNFDIRPLLRKVSFLREDGNRVNEMLAEWNEYRRRVDIAHCTAEMDPERIRSFWETNAEGLPCFFAAAQDLILGQPSSAAAERVFSVLKNVLGEQQYAALKDYVEFLVMVRYNDKKRENQ